MFLKRKLALFMAAVFLVPFIWNQNMAVALAATPTFINDKVEIAGIGETYQLEIQNKVSKSKYTWTSSNKAIATVNSKGLVTSVGSGTVNVKCKITYPSKKTKTLSCKVTVTIPVTPTLVNDQVEIAGVGKTYQLEIQNEVANSKYVWSTTNSSIATVTSDGLITSVGSGTANIKCKITYPSKKSKTLSCMVTVTLPATKISITNANLTNNAYLMTIGSTADLDTALVPENSTDKTYWSIDEDYSDSGCIRIDDPVAGKITALKAGKVALKVKAVKNATQEEADQSIVSAGIIIEVAAPTFTVKSAEIVNSNQITIVFNNPVQKSTVIGTDKKLTTNIDIKAQANIKNVMANDPGTLTPALSEDGKTLTITTANQMKGDYRISFASTILSTSSIALEAYIKTITYVDTIAPYIVGTPTIDDAGTTCTVHFSEAIDTGYKVGNAQMANGNQTMTEYTRSILNTSSNYILSADKKSISINLSGIPSEDSNKSFNITISAVKDLSGNVPASAYLIATIYTDKAPKAQAQLINIERTSYNTLTATYSRAISFGGYLQIENGISSPGTPDTTDTKKVNYTISDTEAKYSGSKAVSVRGWNSYNVIPTDLTANTPQTRYVSFDVDKVPPVLTNSTFDAASGILTLTYSENVNLTSVVSAFTARVNTQSQDVKDGVNLAYTMVTHTDGNNIIKLHITNMLNIGYYTFAVPQGFVTDNFKNMSAVANVTINNVSGGTELAGPYMVTQSTTDPSKITLSFMNKLDIASARNISNYSITGVNIISAEVQSNSDTGATVILTVQDGSIDLSVDRQLKISGVMGYNGNYTAITSYSQWITLKDNKKPYFISSVFDASAKNAIHLNFSEAMQGSLFVNATLVVNGSATGVSLGSPIVTISGNVVNVIFSQTMPSGSYIKLDIISNNLTDTSGNAVTFDSTTIGTVVTY